MTALGSVEFVLKSPFCLAASKALTALILVTITKTVLENTSNSEITLMARMAFKPKKRSALHMSMQANIRGNVKHTYKSVEEALSYKVSLIVIGGSSEESFRVV